jgi:hypothetical protein
VCYRDRKISFPVTGHEAPTHAARWGKWLEARGRYARTLLSPRYRRSYAGMAARGMDARRAAEPVVCFDFSSQQIDAVGGRYYYSLVRDFIDAGYFPVLVGRRPTVSTFGTSRMKSQLLGERMGFVRSAGELGEGFVWVGDEAAPPPGAARVIRVDYEARLPSAPNEVPFPVFVHPQLAAKVDLPMSYDPLQRRPVRLFFGGNTREDKYDSPVLADVYRVLSRREMLDVAQRAVPAERMQRPGTVEEFFSITAGGYVLCETQHCRIAQERWLEALADCDFFLACPGVGMPLCHNLIEAMAAGAIPVIQYGDYLSPALEDGLNCMKFHDAPSLGAVIEEVMAMDEAGISQLRAGVREYYLAHQAPGAFARKLVAGDAHEHKVMLLNSYRVPR